MKINFSITPIYKSPNFGSSKGHNEMPIYVIDKNGVSARYESRAEAARQLRLDKHVISDCVTGKRESAGGFAFVDAGMLEKNDRSERLDASRALLANLCLNFSKKSCRAVYAISQEGYYKKFDSPEQADEELNIPKYTTSRCLSGELGKSHGYTFVKASEIEIQGEDGSIKINEEKLSELVSRFDKKGTALYAVDKKGNFTRYESINEAAKEIGVDKTGISLCLTGARRTSGGYAYIDAETVESFDENGRVSIDRTAIARTKSNFLPPEKFVYAISKDGTIQKFSSAKEASEAIGIEPSRISACICGKRKRTGDYTFIKAQEVESKDEDGNYTVNPRKIKKVLKRFKNNEVYAIKGNGEYIKFPNCAAAAKKLGLDHSSISKSANGSAYTVGGYRFIHADLIEMKLEDGSMVADKSKIDAVIEHLQKRALYIIKANGEYERADDKWHAAREHKGIFFSRGTGRFKAFNGYAYVMAKDVEEKDENGNYVLNKEKLEKEIERLRKMAVYIVDKNRNAERFNNRRYAELYSDKYEYDTEERQYKPVEDFHLLRAIDIESQDENGQFYLDNKKLTNELKKCA